jgi:hypothetical protein
MANAFFYDNKLVSVQASLTPSSENALYPRTNVKDYNAATVWRTNDANAGYTLDNDFGSAVTIDTCAIANPNFQSTATIKIQASTTANFAVLNVDETLNLSGLGLYPPHSNLFHKLASAQTYRYWRLNISDIGNPAGFYEVCEWCLGQRVIMATGQDFQTTNTQAFPDPNILHQTEWLHEYAYIRDVKDIRAFTLEWTEVFSATRDQLRVLKRAIKNSGYPFFFALDQTTAPVEAFLVRMIGDFQSVQENPRTFTIRFELRETARGITLPSVI